MSLFPYKPSLSVYCFNGSMAFYHPIQENYISQQELHYDYPSPTESNSPYTPLDVDSSQYATQRLTDMYRRNEDQSSSWQLSTNSDAYAGATVLHDHVAESSSPVGVSQYSSGLPLHAPMPLPKQSSLLFSDHGNFNYPAIQNSPAPDQFRFIVGGHVSEPAPRGIPEEQHPSLNPDFYSLKPNQPTFPTPSEMLGDVVETPWFSTDRCNVDETLPDQKSDTLRSARRRAMAKSIGFVPTDPCAAIPTPPHIEESSLIVSPSDSISSHEKKRHYLECLENYVIYLHQQLYLVGTQPVNMERASPNSRGMISRSIRTLLVHMENMNRKLNLQILTEEQRFMNLRQAVAVQDESFQEYHGHTMCDN